MIGCSKHRKYTGKRKPKYECIDCLNLYFYLHKAPRAPIKHTKIFKDKTKYTRKNKDKSEHE